MKRTCFLALALIAGLPAVACKSEILPMKEQAIQSSDNAAVGFWKLVGQEGRETCLFSMNQLPDVHGFGVQVENCNLDPNLRPAAWRPTQNGFELINGAGAVAMRFRPVTVDSFETTDDRYRLERAPMS